MELKSGYKASMFGPIPKDWQVTILRKLVDPKRTIRYGIVQPGSYDENGKYMVRGQDYSFGWVDPKYLFRVSDAVEAKYKNARLKSGDIILTIVGAGTGTVAMVPEWLNGANITQTTARIAINEEFALSTFCYYFLSSSFGKRITYQNIKGGAQPGLNCGDIEEYPIPLPPLPEQNAISNLLSVWDKTIDVTTALITQKQLRKKWLMQQLLPGKKRLKGFKGEWREARLGDLCKLVNGMAFKPEDWTATGLPIIRIQNLNGAEAFNYYDKEVESKYIVENKDLLFAWSGSRGTSFGAFEWAGGKAILNQHIFNVYPKKELSKDFALQILKWLTIGIERRAHGSAGLVHVTKKQLEGERMYIPTSISEQNAIASILQVAEIEIQVLQAKLDKLKEQKKGLMQVLLTGKKRLKIK
jgi:type I restriction enzyme S subunit